MCQCVSLRLVCGIAYLTDELADNGFLKEGRLPDKGFVLPYLKRSQRFSIFGKGKLSERMSR